MMKGWIRGVGASDDQWVKGDGERWKKVHGEYGGLGGGIGMKGKEWMEY